MTLVGHSIVGLSLGVVLMPRGLSRRVAGGFLLLAGVMATLPDWRVPYHRNLFSYIHHHSLLVNGIILAGIAGGLALAGRLKSRRGWLVFAAISAAVLSHLVLDSFYSHGYGVDIGWPFGEFRLPMPIPWLHVQTVPIMMDWPHIRIRLMELLTFGPLLALAILGRMAIVHERARRL